MAWKTKKKKQEVEEEEEEDEEVDEDDEDEEEDEKIKTKKKVKKLTSEEIQEYLSVIYQRLQNIEATLFRVRSTI